MNCRDMREIIDEYVKAERAVLQGKMIKFNGQEMTTENLDEIRQGRQEWELRLAREQRRLRGGGIFKHARFVR
ncbi:hypothetical protein [Klebsiella sp. PL-2018]|uniref:hypothetical protein n=1 Tax=Klebsiella sp. PL-2018 TaxID=2851540 RepID=UPI001C247AC5|nr:hypothetical protein [Klebsiella sp. PL-2018]QXC99326.1 Phage protein [Klebsiella sp. PL-2018]